MTDQPNEPLADAVKAIVEANRQAQDKRAHRKAVGLVGGIRQYKKLKRLALSELNNRK